MQTPIHTPTPTPTPDPDPNPHPHPNPITGTPAGHPTAAPNRGFHTWGNHRNGPPIREND